MISAHPRVLLQRQLASNAHLRKISSISGCSASVAMRRPQSIGICRMNYRYNYNHATASSMVHLASSFSSPAAAEGEAQVPHEHTANSEIVVNNAVEEDAILKDSATRAPPANDDNYIVTITNSSSSFSGDSASLNKNGDSPPPLELVSEEITDTATIPPENVIRTGKIEWIDFKRMYGLILQDEPYRTIGPLKKDTVLFFFQQIYPEYYIDEKIQLEPHLDRSRRIRFQARPCPKKEGVLLGFNLRYVEEGKEGSSGNDIPLLHWKGAITFIKSAKAKMGRKVFDLLANASVNEDKELAIKVDEEIEACKKRIEWARNVMANPEKATRECKAKLGEEMFGMLSNIDQVDNIQRRAHEAYMRCRDDLSMLRLSLEPNKQGFAQVKRS